MGIHANANRYAADLVVVDSEGNLWRGDPWDKRHWLSYGADVLAPASGTVIATANDIPDNELIFFAGIVRAEWVAPPAPANGCEIGAPGSGGERGALLISVLCLLAAHRTRRRRLI